MKKTIIILLLTAIFSGIKSQNIEENYGVTWTKIFQAKNKLQAKHIKRRYEKANIGQEISINEDGYYIELSYYDDDIEKFGNKYCIPKRLRKRIKIIEFMTYDGKNPIDLGGVYLTF